MLKPVVKMKHWGFRQGEHGEQMTGLALDHPRLGEEWVRTSLIVKKDIERGRVETMNSIYELVGPAGL